MVASGRRPPGEDPHRVLIEELLLLHRTRRDWVAITLVIHHGTARSRYHCRLPAEDESAELRCDSGRTQLS